MLIVTGVIVLYTSYILTCFKSHVYIKKYHFMAFIVSKSIYLHIITCYNISLIMYIQLIRFTLDTLYCGL